MKPVVAYLALGSNEGDRINMMFAAVERLHNTPGIAITKTSPIYETRAAEGASGQANFLNAAVAIETTLSPEALLTAAHEIEHTLGRRRTVPDGPRPIDIDILLYDNLVRTAPDPIIPHPRMHRRRFVLQPLHDIAPDISYPPSGKAVADMLDALPSSDSLEVTVDAVWHFRHVGTTSHPLERIARVD